MIALGMTLEAKCPDLDPRKGQGPATVEHLRRTLERLKREWSQVCEQLRREGISIGYIAHEY